VTGPAQGAPVERSGGRELVQLLTSVRAAAGTDGLSEPYRSTLVFGVVSAEGDVEALARVLRPLPRSFAAAVLLVQHRPPGRQSEFIAWLQRRTRLEVRPATDRVHALAGCVYVAPDDLHLVIRSSGRLRVSDGPLEHGLRPAGDVLLRSLASAMGPRGAAVLLGDAHVDGVNGAAVVRVAGGRALLRAGGRAHVLALPRSLEGRLGPLEVLDDTLLGERMLALSGGLQAVEEPAAPQAGGP
jgi:two-component system chemotaxis response regulator CheB